jgi:hypothetical protein
MQANFDARAAAAGTSAAPMERRQPEARKDRWMQELERAAMAESAAARAVPRATEARVPETSAVQEAAPSQRGASAATAHREGGAHGVSGRGAAYLGADARIGAEWSAPRSTGTAASTAAVPAHRWAAARSGAGPLQPAASAAQQVAGAAPARVTATPAMALQLGPAPAAMSDTEAAFEAPLPERQAAHLQPDGEAYARSLLHLVHLDDGVHAWLRDASLSQAQARRVASAMAGELALAGSPLAALTVNGRRILSPGASGDPSGRRAADLPGEADVPPLPPVAFKGA